MLTYGITATGYVVYRDGAVLITQDQVPRVAGKVAFTDDNHKRECAEAHVAELTPPQMAPEA